MEQKFTKCPFRQITDDGKLICALAKTILKSKHDELYVTDDKTCGACYDTKEIPNEKKINTVVAGILDSAANKIINAGGFDDCSVDRANMLKQYISSQLPKKPCGCKSKSHSQPTMIRNIGNVT